MSEKLKCPGCGRAKHINECIGEETMSEKLNRESAREALSIYEGERATTVYPPPYIDRLAAAAQAWLDQGDALVTDDMIERAVQVLDAWDEWDDWHKIARAVLEAALGLGQ